MSLNKIENFFLLLYIYLSPILYFEISVPLFGGNLGKIIALVLLALFFLRLIVSMKLPTFPNVGLKVFLSYIILISTISLFFAIPFARQVANNLEFNAQPMVRYMVQMGSLLTMLPIFYYAYRYAYKNGIRFQKHLLIVFGILICAGFYQLLASSINLPYWGVSSSRPYAAFRQLGPFNILRVNSLAGEPKGFASLLIIFAIPFILLKSMIYSNHIKFVGYGSLILLLLTTSASGYVTFLVGLILSMYILATKLRQAKIKIYKTIVSIASLYLVGGIIILFFTPIQALLIQQFQRVGAVAGINQGRAFLSQIFLDIPLIGKLPFDATDASPLAFLLHYPWAMITGVGQGMVSIYAREFFPALHGWLDIGYGGNIDPSIGLIQYLADWGIIGLFLFISIIKRILSRVNALIRFDAIKPLEKKTILFWAISLVPTALFLLNISNGYSGLLLPGLVLGYSDFLEKKYNIK